ncbi:TonB-dependent receptor [Sphingomonas populi]|uniref:TonB-dependent receptor n=1 Tax=Sphingomonas populi TaxID=2484750 RepID=A0A4Q6Y3U1_9SPHN|nr:TonB-dependent receptor [Sphingomonas populi]RZF64049.1 TonB-dependent receptor [Sphingomonas populi]
MANTISEDDHNALPRRARTTLLTASLASLIAVAIASPAAAQTAPPATLPADAPQAAEQDIVVTGSRITTGGFTAPTPTQTIGAADIARNAEPNVFTTIAQLPSLQGSSGVTTGTNSTSSGQQGLSSFSLRGLGTIRTLTLLDGQRVVGANVTGVPDISLFPQLLIKRVDVVTGGASASYGSDAVGGVVNFITDKRFEGFKANLQGGITTYGDNKQVLFQAAAGRAFFNDRLHVEVSGEYDHEDGVPAGGFGEQLAGGRDWYRTTTFLNRNIKTDGSPQYLVRDHAQAYQYTKYGLITGGPLQGTAFDVNGKPFQFQYGSGGVPSKALPGNPAFGLVSGCYAQGGFCEGGDLSGNVGIGTTLQSRLDRYNGYGRIGFDIDPDNELYATVNIAQVDTMNQPNPGATKSGLTLQCSNPFVPTTIQDACRTAGITSFQFGSSNGQLPKNITVYPTRKQYRFVGGAAGKLQVFGTRWNYDVSYEHGENITDIHVKNITLTPRYNAAIQAISLGGQIVCADPIARANGCVPINIIGGAAPSAAALEYIEPGNGPYQHTRQTQDAFNFSFSGSPLSLWAGPVSVAAGAEYRNEFYHVIGDPYGNGIGDGISTETPYTSAYPADPVLNTAGTNWYAGNYHAGRGSYHVAEGFLEVNLPFLKSETLGSANLNVAGRVTNYSTSGTVYTWKIGGTWDTPIDGVRLRAVTSRDVRAPNLSELFAAPITTTIPNFSNSDPNRPNGVPATLTILQNAIGNTALKPEIARNTTAGIVLSRPHWLPGFSASFDYYRIKVNGVISTLNAQQEVDLCYLNNITSLCGAFNLNPGAGTPPYVNLQAFNLASIFTDGFDIEASYQFNLGDVGLPGRFELRGLATNVKNFITDSGVPGTIPTQSAGVNAGNTPHWKLLATENWTTDRFSLSVQQRWFSDGAYNNEYVVCSAGNCPVSTTQHPTIDNNTMPGAFYLDLGGSFNVTQKLNVYFKVDNLLDHDPAPSPQTNTGIDVNQGLYDTLGRLFRVGARFNF